MADDNQNSDENTEAEDGKKLSKKKLILMIAIGVLVLGLGGGGAFLYMGSAETTEEEMSDAKIPAEEMEKEMSFYHELHPAFISNFSGKSDKNYMQVYIVALAREESVVENLELHMPAVRNDVLMTLSKTTSDEIETVEGKEALRKKVLARIRETMKQKTGVEGIEDIYFTKFVAQ